MYIKAAKGKPVTSWHRYTFILRRRTLGCFLGIVYRFSWCTLCTQRASRARASKAQPTTTSLVRDAACVTHTHGRNATPCHATPRHATPADPYVRSLFKLVSSSASFRPDFRVCSGRRVTGFERVTFRENSVARKRSVRTYKVSREEQIDKSWI